MTDPMRLGPRPYDERTSQRWDRSTFGRAEDMARSMRDIKAVLEMSRADVFAKVKRFIDRGFPAA